MLAVNIYPYNGFVEIGIRGLNNGIVCMIHVVECVKALEDKLKEGLQIFRTG